MYTKRQLLPANSVSRFYESNESIYDFESESNYQNNREIHP